MTADDGSGTRRRTNCQSQSKAILNAVRTASAGTGEVAAASQACNRIAGHSTAPTTHDTVVLPEGNAVCGETATGAPDKEEWTGVIARPCSFARRLKAGISTFSNTRYHVWLLRGQL